jgi:Peptidase family M28/PDZ domain
MKKILLFSLLLGAFQAKSQTLIEVENIKKHVSFLASDKLEGRGTSTKGEAKAAKYIAKNFKKLGLKPMGTEGTFFHQFDFAPVTNPHATDDPNKPRQKSKNVVGFLDNGAEFTIVIGAHYDHLGRGLDHNSLDPNPDGKIHNGADDNASGTSGVLELARQFTQNNKKEPYNFLFMCFSGEELGLLGSKKFIEFPTYDLNKVNYMFNMDMIGRFRDEKGLMIQGIGTSSLWGKMIEVMGGDMKIIPDSSGVGPSDYTSFYLKGIPVLGFFTGQHTDYHKPSDDTELINFEGEKKVLDYIVRFVEATCTFPKMDFLTTKQPQNQARNFKVTMGVMPDYAYDKKGMRIDGVTDGKPAAKAGIKTGDVIVKIGETEIENVYTYMDVLTTLKKGETAKVVVKRGNEDVVLDVTF